jgi:hypothetical protein
MLPAREPLDSSTGTEVMIDDGIPTLKWPVILLQIDVNAIPIRSVDDGRAVAGLQNY